MSDPKKQAVQNRRAIRVREVAEIYGIGKTKIYELIKAGELTSVRVGTARLIHVESLEALIGTKPRIAQSGARP